MEEFDAIMVGGGPAGSTVGGFLTRIAKPPTLEQLRGVAGGDNGPGFVRELLSAGVLVGSDS